MISAVGNTVMLHFLLGLNTDSIARAPHRPVFTDLYEIIADKLDIDINPRGMIHILPSISGYIGSDIIADLLNCIIFFKMVVIFIKLYYNKFNGFTNKNYYISEATFLEVI